MKRFKDFGIKPSIRSFVGDKIKIERILNKEITVLDYRIEDSKYDNANPKCLHLQIEKGDMKHVIFTGSSVLIETIQKVGEENLPFETTIVKENEHFEFT